MNRFPPQGVIAKRDLRGNGSHFAKTLMTTLMGGEKSVVLNFIGDSTGNELSEYPALFARKLAEKFPTYNVKYCVYDFGTSKYGAWNNLVVNGEERHILIKDKRVPLRLNKSEVLWTSPDLDIRFKISLDDWDSNQEKIICGRFGAVGSYCWIVKITTSNQLAINWSPDGTSLISKVDYSTNIAALTDGDPYWFRITLDADNGLSKCVFTTYTSEDGISWTQSYTSNTTANTTIYDHENQPYELGGINGYTGHESGLNLKIYEIQLMDGIDGKNIFPQPIESWHQVSGDTSNGGVLSGLPTIYVYNGCVGGLSTTDAANIDYSNEAIPLCFNPVIITSLGHNDGYVEGASYITLLDTLIDNIKTKAPNAILVWMTQSPHITTESTPALYVLPHEKRRVNQVAYCQLNNIELIDACLDFLSDGRGLAALLNDDGLHPNAAGEAVLANAIWDYVNILGK